MNSFLWLNNPKLFKSHFIVITMDEPLKDSYRGKRCFILAAGPSLAYKDLSFLKNEVTIALNLAIVTLDIYGINPTFNIIADKYQYVNYREVYEKLTYKTPVKKIIVASACDTFPKELIDENTFLFPIKLQQEKAAFSENPLKDGFSRGKTVAFDAIQLAYYLGFDEVYIIGMDLKMDCDWGNNGHCYEIQTNPRFKDMKILTEDSHEIQRGPPNHPEYMPLIKECMALAKSKFDESNRKLINDSRSYLDILDKMDILKEFGNVKKVVAFVPAKGTSSRVPSKNVRVLNNKPLFLHILDTLLSCHAIDEVYLDTESEEVFRLAEGRKHKCLRRDPGLATNRTDGNQLLLNEAAHVEADIYVQALPTAPFISQRTIDEAVFSLLTSKNNDSLFTVTRDNVYVWKKDGTPANYNPLHIPNSFDLEETIVETMGLYIIRKGALFERKCRIGRSPIFFDTSFIESIDIDTPEDFELADAVFRGWRHSKMSKLKERLSTALISDVLDEEGFRNQMLPVSIKPNFPEAKIFGKVRIMSLKPLKENESYKEVYRGLYFLESLDRGDVVIISNGFEDCAFFGELMSTLSMARGIEGAIVEGCMRDRAMTTKMRYPVFAKDTIARDIKRRGIIDQIDADSAKIGEVLIQKGDYVFGDIDGAIIIPAKIKDRIIEKALKAADIESKIKKSMHEGRSVKSILDEFGEF